MAIKIYKVEQVLIIEDSAIEDAYPIEPANRYSYDFVPAGSDNVVITNDLKEKAVYNGLITDIVMDTDLTPADKAAGKTYLNAHIG